MNVSHEMITKNKSVKAVRDGFKYVAFSKLGEDLTFEQLTDIDETRKELFSKAKDFDQLQISQSFVGTILPYLLSSPLAWGTIILYIIIRILLHNQEILVGANLPQINTTVTSIVGGFMSFFLVFFLSQAYTRFMAQYTISKNLVKCITRIAYAAKNALPYNEAFRLIRYMNAAHIAGYVGLSDSYSVHNLFDPLNEKYYLLTEKEIERLMKIDMDNGGSALREVIGWSLDIVYSNYRQNKDFSSFSSSLSHPISIEPTRYHRHDEEAGTGGGVAEDQEKSMDYITFQNFLSDIYQFNGSFSDLFNYAEQTFPFSYMHLLVLINGLYLILITYTIATYISVGDSVFPDILGVFILLCNLIFVTGMREIGGHMIDPYGHDVTDLSIISYIQSGIKTSFEILYGHKFQPTTMESELHLHSLRPKLRPGFRKHLKEERVGVNSRKGVTMKPSTIITTATPSQQQQQQQQQYGKEFIRDAEEVV